MQVAPGQVDPAVLVHKLWVMTCPPWNVGSGGHGAQGFAKLAQPSIAGLQLVRWGLSMRMTGWQTFAYKTPRSLVDQLLVG